MVPGLHLVVVTAVYTPSWSSMPRCVQHLTTLPPFPTAPTLTPPATQNDFFAGGKFAIDQAHSIFPALHRLRARKDFELTFLCGTLLRENHR